MKITRTAIIPLLSSLILLTNSACRTERSEAAEQEELKKQAKVSESTARATALARVPDGKVEESELEEEHGKLIWSFDLSRPGTKDVTEVQVDAKTGAIVAVETETPKEQSKEHK